jgi:prepilin-type N-terminal cleavage/methylation domain-containing protein
MWKDRSPRREAQTGFTLIEVLIGIAIAALVAVAAAAVSITAVVSIGEDSVERQQEATTAQWAAQAFARDVQGAVGLVGQCASGGTHLVTLAEADGRRVEYRSRQDGATFALVRVECDSGVERVVVDELTAAPTVRCASVGGVTVPCAVGSTPRRLSLSVQGSPTFPVELDGARRTTDGNSAQPPFEVPTFVALGGGTPLSAGGNSQLRVVGNAFINRPASGNVAVQLQGGSGSPADPSSYRLFVTGDFALQSGAICPNCSTHANEVPTTFDNELPDPLRFTPEPPTDSLPTRTNCPVTAGVRVCQPGIYEVEFPPAQGGGGVKDFVLEPGVYALRGGVKITNGSLVGDGVLLYLQSGDVKVTGADLDLSPPDSGIYRGILVFQARDNTAGIEILGNAALASLDGTIYAPSSTGVVLGGGGGELYVGRVVGKNLSTSGGGDGGRRWLLNGAAPSAARRSSSRCWPSPSSRSWPPRRTQDCRWRSAPAPSTASWPPPRRCCAPRRSASRTRRRSTSPGRDARVPAPTRTCRRAAATGP